ncbi:MAG: DoxX family protein [Candidatus Hydrogenedentota bacterium]
MKRFFQTDTEWFGLITRVFLGAVFLPHGLQKTLGAFGGYGFSGTMEFMTGMGMPWIVALLVVAGESLGALGLITGFLTRLSAFGIVAIMSGAIVMVHAKFGFFMNWFGNQQGEGVEYHLLAMGMAFALLVGGAGRWSVDGFIARKIQGEIDERRG